MFAQGIGLLAEVTFDLQQSLLECGGAEDVVARAAEHPVPGEPESRVIFGGGPGEVTLFGDQSQFLVAAEDGPRAEPGQHHIDGEVGDALGAEERLGAVEAGGMQVPMPGPEGVGIALE
jgi:hypothetical protein